MKKVTFLGRKDGVERPGVRVGQNTYLLDEALVVPDADAKGLPEEYKFKVENTDERRSSPQDDDAPLGGSAGGFGGSQGSVEAEPSQEQE